MARRDHPLYRYPEDKMIGGVCGGIGRYFDVDTTLIRVLFVVLALAGGSGLIAYVILWIVLAPAPADAASTAAPDTIAADTADPST